MTADVQRELAEALDVALPVDVNATGWMSKRVAERLLPTVQALIADAEKRAAARVLHAAARFIRDQRMDAPEATAMLRALTQAAALDPSGAAEGAGR